MRLPKRPGGKGPTLGIYVDDDGIEHTVRSGVEEDGLDKDLARYMWERRLVPAWMTNPGAAQHVEMKVAYRMRESGTRCVELAINNRVDPETWGCDRLLPAVLRRGQMLIIHDVEGTKIYRGRSE
ncbi:SCP1.201-like deaminase [Streptoalloteichus tenebrarius]|uniref:SCP1.201-like deaminase n=2 Tax=Streptoalloteichus tenebrarius (strain ATCC 17920 / DSM 40477 / JCM 4838 / CBS 697.72 / NBRC 16177 / NCIMB 11028 / NRRL B-12390 / A12253. 1 / ISP 5477) TaxID=1933 RepID=A0ABT1HLH9_STRSD|nr:SCP1.201-like deaminase [Streptoalloteichus tenebrarius]